MRFHWLCLVALPLLCPAARAQEISLPPVTAPRCAVTDRTWPTAPHLPQVCLWKDDKLAAFSLTIDDNHAEDHAYWLELGATYDWSWTWFVIAGRVGQPGPWGTWEGWRAIHAAGHDVQSHSVFHLDPRQAAPLSIEREYVEARAMIEEQVPGARALTLAYPNGFVPPNDAGLAARTYLAVRGVKGFLNAPATVNYREVNSVSAASGFLEPETHWASLAGMLNSTDSKKYRAWYCCHFHGLNAALKTHVAAMLALLKQHEADVWIGAFRAVAQYGQERDTAQLAVVSSDATAVSFELRDAVSDAEFDQPLTIKIRLPEGWTSAQARQAGQPVSVAVVEHDHAYFALVSATPDRGLVEVVP